MGQIRRHNEKVLRQRIRKRKEAEAELDKSELLSQSEHLHPRPTTSFEAAKIIEEICIHDTLEPPSSSGAYKESLNIAHDLLIKADLQADQLQNYESVMMAERQRQTSTRKSVHKGGGINVGQWMSKIDERDRTQAIKELRNMEQKIKTAFDKANTALSRKGIESRKAKREYLKTLGTSPSCPIIIGTFGELDKYETFRTVEEVASLLPPPDLQQTLNLLKEDI